jgi:nucleotide-binding universal stress UspA family protein
VYKHILISTDGSALARKGVDHGLSLAKALGSKVTIITATEPFPVMGTASAAGWVATPQDFESYEESRKRFAEAILAPLKAVAEKMGVEAKTVHVPDAFAASAIVDTAQKEGCSLIVMASHGRRGVKRLLLGSQAAEVVSSSPVPVLVVR